VDDRNGRTYRILVSLISCCQNAEVFILVDVLNTCVVVICAVGYVKALIGSHV